MTDNGIRTLRKYLDQMAGSIEDSELSSRPGSLAVTHIQSARMWLGECLAELGLSTPYKESLDPTSETIAPEADVASRQQDPWMPPSGSPIKYVKELRVSLVEQTEKLRQEIHNGESSKKFYVISTTQAYVHLCNARMWLGKELDRRHSDS